MTGSLLPLTFRIGRNKHRRVAGQAQLGKSLEAKILFETCCDTFEFSQVGRGLVTINEFLKNAVDRVHSGIHHLERNSRTS
ncbi:hypothetical protein [Bradyrhizobium sp. 170]|uniref:hypothetical protein n=1 Tax=Bradyrhizobium sp. 170 TaxID=2782641 RepID=UPI001FFF300F|nr:hypothetical protein [Bradyrhizobium sp. 170]UPK05840.1 hypothetical protein IVB05_09910 [Bradyrhizobium sp. 170]